MRASFRIVLFTALLAATGVLAAAPTPASKTLTPQQQKMSDCSKQSAGKTGEARKAFMSACLKGHAMAKPTPQQKMKSCNAEASSKALKGDARKAFMSTCLKG